MGASEVRVAVRIWVPDRPGVLGAVATRIGGIRGNVVGLEVLERDNGIAVDDLVVELPDAALIPDMCNQIRLVEGAGVEDVHAVAPFTEERGLQVMEAAIAIMETANSAASLAALTGRAADLFELDWAVLLDLREGGTAQSLGPAPPVPWLTAFVTGARTPDGGAPTDGSGVLSEELPTAGLVLCVGRGVPFRRRERRELEMLARVTDRVWAALEPGPAAHPGW